VLSTQQEEKGKPRTSIKKALRNDDHKIRYRASPDISSTARSQPERDGETNKTEREARRELGCAARARRGRRGTAGAACCTSAVDLLGETLEAREAARAAGGLVAVDGEDHACAAVDCGDGLTAVDPDRGRVVDNDVERGEGSRASSHGVEARVKADLASRRRELELAARIVERRLSDSVILRFESEANRVARLGNNVRWAESKLAIGSDVHEDNAAGQGARSGVRRARERSVRGGPSRGLDGDGRSHDCAGWVREESDAGDCGRVNGLGSSDRGRRRGSSVDGRLLEVGERIGGAIRSAVNGEDHAGVAMESGALGAVEPKGLGVRDGVSDGREIGVSSTGSNWLVSGVEAPRESSTRTGKRTLDDGVIL